MASHTVLALRKTIPAIHVTLEMLYGELRELSGASKGSELVRSVQAVYRQKLVPAVVGRL